MPPTFAAASNTYSGLSVSKKFSTSVCRNKFNSWRLLVMIFTYPKFFNCLTIAEPTRPL